MSIATQTQVSAVLDSGFEVAQHQISKTFTMLQRTGQVDGQSFTFSEGTTSASLIQKLQNFERLTFDDVGVDSLMSAYRKAVRNQQRAVISIHLPNALYGGVQTAKYVRNLSSFGEKIHIFELLTMSNKAALRIIGFVDKAIKHNWSPLPIIKVVNDIRRQMRSVYVVSADSPPINQFNQSKLLNRLTAQRDFVTFTIDTNGHVQILERGAAEKLVQRAPQWLQQITRVDNLKNGILQTHIHGLDAIKNQVPSYTSIWSPLTIAGLGKNYLEMSWMPSREATKQLVKKAHKLYGQAVTYNRPLYEYSVNL